MVTERALVVKTLHVCYNSKNKEHNCINQFVFYNLDVALFLVVKKTDF